MTTTTLKPGDTVRVKSGGPLMTIKSLDGKDVICTWFEKDKKKESRFDPVTLEADDGLL